MPSWSAWMIARTNDESSGASTRAAMFFSAAWRDSPIRISESSSAELLDERSLHVLGQLRDRAVEAESGLDADGEQVERVRQVAADGFAAAADPQRRDHLRAR